MTKTYKGQPRIQSAECLNILKKLLSKPTLVAYPNSKEIYKIKKATFNMRQGKDDTAKPHLLNIEYKHNSYLFSRSLYTQRIYTANIESITLNTERSITINYILFSASIIPIVFSQDPCIIYNMLKKHATYRYRCYRSIDIYQTIKEQYLRMKLTIKGYMRKTATKNKHIS